MSMVDTECGWAGECVNTSRDTCRYRKYEPRVCLSVCVFCVSVCLSVCKGETTGGAGYRWGLWGPTSFQSWWGLGVRPTLCVSLRVTPCMVVSVGPEENQPAHGVGEGMMWFLPATT